MNDLVERYVSEHIQEEYDLLRTLGRIPAPSRCETKRAEFIRSWLATNGAANVKIDDANNVICLLGPQDGDLVVFAAHTDIVFPDTEELPMREVNGRLYAPGIGDDTANLVNLLMAAKYLLQGGHMPSCGLLIAANSCEEGLGNLDGTRELFASYGSRIRAFYSFDLYTSLCTATAVGSYRYRVTCRTAGGHSFVDFGNKNAIAVLADLIGKLYQLEVPADPVTTYNVGKIEGGTTVNSIAQEASMLFEFRSISQKYLEKMEHEFYRIAETCSTPDSTIDIERIGLRPGNGPVDPEELRKFTERSAEIIREHYNGELDFGAYSTDSNIPLSLGIPANTIGTVVGGGAHTREEWIELDSLKTGLKIVISLMLQYI